MEEFGFASNKVLVAHQMSNPGSINEQIIRHILDSTLVIVNLTGLNANVMYELAVRHAAAKPVISICEKEITSSLPFDINQERTIFYSDTFHGATLLKNSLNLMVQEVMKTLDEDARDNPIYRVLKDQLIKQEVKEKNPSEAPFVDLMISIRDQVTSLEQSVRELKAQPSPPFLVSDAHFLKFYLTFKNEAEVREAKNVFKIVAWINTVKQSPFFKLIVVTDQTIIEIRNNLHIYKDLKERIIKIAKPETISSDLELNL